MTLNSREELGRKLLYDIATGRLDAAGALIERGAWLNVKRDDGRVALHIAAMCGHTGIIDMITARDFDLNPRDDLGYTPLMLAAEQGHAPAVAALLKAGARVSERNRAGLSALDLAKEDGTLLVISMIADKEAEGRATLAEEWKDVAVRVEHEVRVSKPIRLKF